MKHVLNPGMRFGLGVVVQVERRNGKRGALLRCDCGKQYWTQASNLYRSPGTMSCGCHKASVARRGIHHSVNAGVTIRMGY